MDMNPLEEMDMNPQGSFHEDDLFDFLQYDQEGLVRDIGSQTAGADAYSLDEGEHPILVGFECTAQPPKSD